MSRVGDRDGDRFVSPREQVERIQSVAERDGLKLIDTIEELDVSGGSPLAKRHGLRSAVELVEAGQADVLVVAYFDRLVRSLQVQAEVVRRIFTRYTELRSFDRVSHELNEASITTFEDRRWHPIGVRRILC